MIPASYGLAVSTEAQAIVRFAHRKKNWINLGDGERAETKHGERVQMIVGEAVSVIYAVEYNAVTAPTRHLRIRLSVPAYLDAAQVEGQSEMILNAVQDLVQSFFPLHAELNYQIQTDAPRPMVTPMMEGRQEEAWRTPVVVHFTAPFKMGEAIDKGAAPINAFDVASNLAADAKRTRELAHKPTRWITPGAAPPLDQRVRYHEHGWATPISISYTVTMFPNGRPVRHLSMLWFVAGGIEQAALDILDSAERRDMLAIFGAIASAWFPFSPRLYTLLKAVGAPRAFYQVGASGQAGPLQVKTPIAVHYLLDLQDPDHPVRRGRLESLPTPDDAGDDDVKEPTK